MTLERCAAIEVKGKGPMDRWLVRRPTERGPAAPG